MTDLIIRHGTAEFDHIVLGTSRTEDGAAWLRGMTGATVTVTPPEPGQWYHSARMPLVGGSMVEVLGPNPAHKGFHPFKTMLARYQTPALMFWHLGTRDFEALRHAVAAAQCRMERIEHLESETPEGPRAYVRGIIGPGFRSERPCAIQWHAQPDRPELRDPVCTPGQFVITSPIAAQLNTLFAELGLALRAEAGAARLALDLDTPKGRVLLEGGGLVFEGVAALAMTARLWMRHVSGHKT